jgi:hypothetical protein
MQVLNINGVVTFSLGLNSRYYFQPLRANLRICNILLAYHEFNISREERLVLHDVCLQIFPLKLNISLLFNVEPVFL